MNFIKNIFTEAKKEILNFLKSNFKLPNLINFIFSEVKITLKNNEIISKIKNKLVLKNGSFYDNVINFIKILFNYNNKKIFKIKQILFFLLIIKYLLAIVIKKIIFYLFSLNCSVYFVSLKKINIKNKENRLVFFIRKMLDIKCSIINLFNYIFEIIIYLVNLMI
ncbi:hypothetical protein [Candidatus Carsonella ruddii]|uniref:hypothetical protein n=1 Tax=Carsonella ruddii TaxID=114186 RepID=UPI003D4F362E